MSVESIGLVFREARQGRGWSQSTLAAKAGVSRPTVARIENGLDISATSLTKLAGALSMKLAVVPDSGADGARRPGKRDTDVSPGTTAG